MYERLSASYHEANALTNRMNADKIFNYAIKDKDFNVVQTGVCENVRREYDPCEDYNWVKFTDIHTHKNYCVCQFYVNITEVKHS
jgi:hypothetical protein